MKYNEKELVVGLDIGITSVGWAIVDDSTNNLVEFGVRKFDDAKPAAEARINRSARRTSRRKNWRKEQLKEAFSDFGLLPEEDFKKEGYLSFTATHKSQTLDSTLGEMTDQTVYHVRKRGLTEKLTMRELFLALYNITKTRGHFLLEEVDFKSEGISIDAICERIISHFKTYIIFQESKIEDFKTDVLTKLINGQLKSLDLKKLLKVVYTDIEKDAKSNDKLLELLKLLGGWNANLSKVDETLKDKQNIKSIKTNENASEFEVEMTNIYDMIQTLRILNEGYSYLCEKHVDILDKLASFGNITKDKVEENEELKLLFEETKAKMSKGDYKKANANIYNRVKVVKNIENNYPNGLYVKEAVDILKKQQEFNDNITDEFIYVVEEIIKARIPYFMGPLSNDAKNSWIVRNDGKVKYSYNYALHELGLFNEEQSIVKWKNNMISDCTYLPTEKALPKNSFLLELFVILNDLNIYKAENNSDVFTLDKDDKIKVINEVFLKSKDVQFHQIAECLRYDYFGSIKNKTVKKFNKTFSAYHDIVKINSDLKITDIDFELNNLNNENSKINQIENIIQALVLYDDPINKFNVLKREYSEDVATRLSKLNYTDFASISRKFIYNYPMNANGETLVERLLNEEVEQMSIINSATDMQGNKINLSSNKYVELLKDNNKLGSHLLIDGNKPLIPMSRTVVRGINETFKVFNQICKQYGMPKRIVIETASDVKDFNPAGGESASHFDEMKKLYEHINKQHKEQKIDSVLEEWDEINQYLKTNKKKIELYLRQDGKCMLTNRRINLNNLQEYQIDHILPRGFGDNSMNNSMLIEATANAKKANRLPLEYIRDSELGIEQAYIKRVNSLKERKLISEEKQKRLLLENQDEAFGFIQRNLVDTRYIIKEVTSIFEAYKNINEYEYSISSLQGSFNNMYRNGLDFRKNRELGEQHHAHDAGIIIIVDKCLNTLFPNYSSGNMHSQERYKQFITKYVLEVKEQNNNSLSRLLIRKMYFNAFKENYNDIDSLVEQLKEKRPLLSWKVNKKYTGQFFDQNAISQKNFLQKKNTVDAVIKQLNNPELNKIEKYEINDVLQYIEMDEYKQLALQNDIEVLSLLDVNNIKRRYKKTKCVAVDVYKLTIDKKKNKKKFFAVHIPKLIVDQNGNINKSKYISLIKEHYNYRQLLDANGNLIEGAFKIRLFKNDMYYDTARKEINLFNIGSIEDMKLNIKRTNIYSYNELYKIVDKLERKYQFKVDDDKVKFWLTQDEVKHIINNEYEYAIENDLDLQDTKEIILNHKEVKDNDKINKYLVYELFAKCKLDCNYKMNTKKIYSENRPTINNLKNKEAQYVKIVNSILGIRLISNDPKVIIEGKHMKIKNDKFTWKI